MLTENICQGIASEEAEHGSATQFWQRSKADFERFVMQHDEAVERCLAGFEHESATCDVP